MTCKQGRLQIRITQIIFAAKHAQGIIFLQQFALATSVTPNS